MRYGVDDRLYVPSRRIRTRNKHSAEWLSKRGGQTLRAKKLFETPSRQDRCLRKNKFPQKKKKKKKKKKNTANIFSQKFTPE